MVRATHVRDATPAASTAVVQRQVLRRRVVASLVLLPLRQLRLR